VARENYAAVLARDPSDAEVARTARRAFANYGRMLADFVMLTTLTREDVLRSSSVDGLEHVFGALEAGRGAVLVGAHMGNWDFGGAMAAVHGVPLAAVADRFPVAEIHELLVGSREALGMRVLMADRDVLRNIAKSLAENRILALIADLTTQSGVEVEFFGHRAVIPVGPAHIALRSGVPILTFGMQRRADWGYHVIVDPPIDFAPTGRRRDDVNALTQLVVRRLEQHIRATPDQWYAFRRMWSDARAETDARGAA
jgi:KDO2-lipid IV(A) lauroyltransferase